MLLTLVSGEEQSFGKVISMLEAPFAYPILLTKGVCVDIIVRACVTPIIFSYTSIPFPASNVFKNTFNLLSFQHFLLTSLWLHFTVAVKMMVNCGQIKQKHF